jgi:serine/threonine protein kinase
MANNHPWSVFCGNVIDGKYHLKNLLGAGGFGGVFLADEKILGIFTAKQVAVKLVPVDDEKQDQINELRAATKVKHPNILRYLTGGHCRLKKANFIYLAMELAGDSLEKELQQRNLNDLEIKQLAQEMASALNYLHRMNRPIVHRDLKPGNILRQGSTWKLTDFGLVKQIDSRTIYTSTVGGTLVYMPPEALAGEISPAWDMWSFGVLLLKVLTGQYPYSARTQEELIYQLTHNEPQIPSLRSPWNRIVSGCLKKDRKSRWSAAQVLRELSGFALQLPDTRIISVLGGAALLAIAMSGIRFPSISPIQGTSANVSPEKSLNYSSSCIAQSNKIFFERHPERNGAMIQPKEEVLAREWREIANGLPECSGIPAPLPESFSSCHARTDEIFFTRHPERNGERIKHSEQGLAREWREIRESLPGC